MTILILGASSDVAVSLARKLAAQGHSLQLAARDIDHLAAIKSDLEARHDVVVHANYFDAVNWATHFAFYQALEPKPDIAVIAFGHLGSGDLLSNWEEAQKVLAVNFVGAVSILNVIASDFENRRSGIIVGISSVAGERGRMSNFIYGSAKAGLTTYLSGLRNRMYHSRVHVITVKPGFMDTKMTEGLPLPKTLTASAEQAAEAILTAIRRKKNVVYVLPVWQVIMWVIRNIPERVFKKLKL